MLPDRAGDRATVLKEPRTKPGPAGPNRSAPLLPGSPRTSAPTTGESICLSSSDSSPPLLLLLPAPPSSRSGVAFARPPVRFPRGFSSPRPPRSGAARLWAFLPVLPPAEFLGLCVLGGAPEWVLGGGARRRLIIAGGEVFRGGLGVRSFGFVRRSWVRSGGFGAVDLKCWFWVEESGREVAILLPHFGRCPFWESFVSTGYG